WTPLRLATTHAWSAGPSPSADVGRPRKGLEGAERCSPPCSANTQSPSVLASTGRRVAACELRRAAVPASSIPTTVRSGSYDRLQTSSTPYIRHTNSALRDTPLLLQPRLISFS